MKKQPKMKKFGDALRDDPSYDGKRSSCSPRTRPGQTYPGGKHMRKALAKLALRNRRYGENISRGHEYGNDFYKPGSPSRKFAGSMNGEG